jgi:hypothetical protein
MNESLELKNNPIIYSRAIDIAKKRLGSLSAEMILDIRRLFLRSSWEIQATQFRLTRSSLGLALSEVAEDLKITITDLINLERGDDFMNRDIIAEALKSYLQLPFN